MISYLEIIIVNFSGNVQKGIKIECNNHSTMVIRHGIASIAHFKMNYFKLLLKFPERNSVRGRP